MKRAPILTIFAACVLLASCSSDAFEMNSESPTAGVLRVNYDEGLAPHVKNQAATFESQYPNVRVRLFECGEPEAITALYNDSCEAIVISRLLGEKELKAFESKGLFPKYSAVAKSGVAVIANGATSISYITTKEIRDLLTTGATVKDTLLKPLELSVLLDGNSGAVHYLIDSVVRGKISSHCSVLPDAAAVISFIASNSNAIGFIDFAWISDADDPLNKKYMGKVRLLGVSDSNGNPELPSQSSFKLATYPFTRTIYVLRKTGEFTTAKGFESFVAGPKGQLTFLKQGLLPVRQAERNITIKTGEEE
jgi:ABC-type phosphate transport system substrate-binding protein